MARHKSQTTDALIDRPPSQPPNFQRVRRRSARRARRDDDMRVVRVLRHAGPSVQRRAMRTPGYRVAWSGRLRLDRSSKDLWDGEVRMTEAQIRDRVKAWANRHTPLMVPFLRASYRTWRLTVGAGRAAAQALMSERHVTETVSY